MKLLGAILRKRAAISESDLADALNSQARHGSRIGEILIAEGKITYPSLYAALAEHRDLPFVDLAQNPPDAALLAAIDPELCLALKSVPLRKDGELMHIATAEPSEAVVNWATQTYGPHIAFSLTTPLDIRRAIETHHGSALEDKSHLSLWQRSPHLSARATATHWQKFAFTITILSFTMACAFFPYKTFFYFLFFCNGLYAISMLFKAILFLRGWRRQPSQGWPEKIAALNEKTLPIYTVLVPMYHEKESLPGLIQAISALDYPVAKLDIKLVMEADDLVTFAAACALKPAYNFDIIRVPPGLVRTKPKACNYALHFARGELLTVFDADDRPDPLQLKKSVIALRTAPHDVVCLQARLNYWNGNENWITRSFSLEYAMLFHCFLPGMERFKMPIPLGGTSNHIAFDTLKKFGEWDAYNVTEDADLGTRLAGHGFRTAVLDSDTFEEAPNRLLPWIRQRSRWIKGYMQTWFVHMRNPFKLYRALGFKAFLGFQCFIGLPALIFLSAPALWMISPIYLSNPQPGTPEYLLLNISIANLIAYLLLHWTFAFACIRASGQSQRSMSKAAFFFPLYLMLNIAACYRALWQLFTRPHFWDKTTHGLARVSNL